MGREFRVLQLVRRRVALERPHIRFHPACSPIGRGGYGSAATGSPIRRAAIFECRSQDGA